MFLRSIPGFPCLHLAAKPLPSLGDGGTNRMATPAGSKAPSTLRVDSGAQPACTNTPRRNHSFSRECCCALAMLCSPFDQTESLFKIQRFDSSLAPVDPDFLESTERYRKTTYVCSLKHSFLLASSQPLLLACVVVPATPASHQHRPSGYELPFS